MGQAAELNGEILPQPQVELFPLQQDLNRLLSFRQSQERTGPALLYQSGLGFGVMIWVAMGKEQQLWVLKGRVGEQVLEAFRRQGGKSRHLPVMQRIAPNPVFPPVQGDAGVDAGGDGKRHGFSPFRGFSS